MRVCRAAQRGLTPSRSACGPAKRSFLPHLLLAVTAIAIFACPSVINVPDAAAGMNASQAGTYPYNPVAPAGANAPILVDSGTGLSTSTSAPTTRPGGVGAAEPMRIGRRIATNPAGGLADDAAGVGFRSDTSHIFCDAGVDLLEDTAADRSLIQSAIEPGSLRSTINLPDGSSLARYLRTLPDGTKVWAEARNGVEITDGGLNAMPR